MLRALKGMRWPPDEDRAISLADHPETNQTRPYNTSALHLRRPLLFLPLKLTNVTRDAFPNSTHFS